MEQDLYLQTLQQYQQILHSELKQLEQSLSSSAKPEAFNNLQQTVSMIFSKLAEGSPAGSYKHSICPLSSRPQNYLDTCPALSQQLFSEIRTKSQELERADRKFRKRLDKIEILLYQKDYDEALAKIDSYKKNNVTFQTEDSEEALKSINDSINQAFYNTDEVEPKHNQAYNTLKEIIDDDAVSLSIKEQLLFDLYCPHQSDEQTDELTHVNLKQILQLKVEWDRQNKGKSGLQLFVDPNEDIQNNNSNPFQNRVEIKNIKNLLEQSIILPKDKLKIDKLQQIDKSQLHYQHTGKKKPVNNITNLSCLNLISEVYNSETGKKVVTKRERSMTGRKKEPGDEKKSKTLHKETEKKKAGKRQVAFSKAFR